MSSLAVGSPRSIRAPREAFSAFVPGLLAMALLAWAAREAAGRVGVIPDVALALAVGIVVRNAVGMPGILRPGIAFTLRGVLRAAIVAFGAGLTFGSIVAAGASTLALVGLCFVVALALGWACARMFRLSSVVGLLIGAGTAICGGSAILALGPLVRATDEEIAYAVSTIFTFNIVGLLAFPSIGHALGLSPAAFGSWSGTAVNDTSVVIATGYVYGAKAGAVATIVKLTRTLLLVPLALVVGLRAPGDAPDRPVSGRAQWHRLARIVPWFIFGFVAMAALNSAGLVSPGLDRALVGGASFGLVMVLGAVGCSVDLAKLRTLGARPLIAGMLLATVMAVVSLTLVRLLRIG